MKASSLRWIVLAFSFVILTYGGLIGLSFGEFLPTFSCRYVDARAGDCFLWHVQHHFSGHGGPGYLVRATHPMLLYFFLLIIVLGKGWCGWICPFGFLMDLLDLIRRRVFRLGYLFFPEGVRRRLAVIKWVLLFMALFLPLATFPFFMRSGIAMDLSQPYCQWCPAKYIMPLFAGDVDEIAVNFRTPVGIVMTSIGLAITGLFFIGALTKRRFWCSFCPMGLLIGLCRKISFLKIKKDCQACTRCGICYNVCPMDITEIYTERKKSDVTFQDCIQCMRCIEKCPENDVLRATFCGLPIYRSTQKSFFSEYETAPGSMPCRLPDLAASAAVGVGEEQGAGEISVVNKGADHAA